MTKSLALRERQRPQGAEVRRAKRVQRRFVASVAVAMLATACSGSDSDETFESNSGEDTLATVDSSPSTVDSSPSTVDSSPSTVDSSPSTVDSTAPDPGEDAEGTTQSVPTEPLQENDEARPAVSDLLAQVYSTSEDGDGIQTGCRARRTDATWSVELSDSWGSDPADWGTPVLLCIYGLRDDLPIQISTIINGSAVAETTFEPSADARHPLYPGAVCADDDSTWCARPRESRELLFEDSTRPIFRSPDGPWLETNDWVLATEHASDIERAGGFQLEISQAGESASFAIEPSKPRTDYGLVSWLEEVDGTLDELVIYGFERGRTIPLGVYEAETQPSDSSSFGLCPNTFRLVSAIAEIEIPPTGFAVVRVPAEVLAAMQNGTYSIAGPPIDGYSQSALWVDGERRGSCQVGTSVLEEPSAGPLRIGHHGTRVLRLKEELLRLGYLDDLRPFVPGADDLGFELEQYFGSNTAWAVRAFQTDNNLVIDGVAGPQTHEALGIDY